MIEYDMSYFNVAHIIVLLLALLVLPGALVLFHYVARTDGRKVLVLKLLALVTLLLHWSILHYRFLRDGRTTTVANVLFPLYPCNLAMYLLFFVAFFKPGDKEGRAHKVWYVLAVFTAYLGFVGSVSTLAFPYWWTRQQTVWSWETLQGIFSHAALLLASLYLVVGKFIRVQWRNIAVLIIGGILMIGLGHIMQAMLHARNITGHNPMFLFRSPVAGMDFFTWHLIYSLALIGATIATATVILTRHLINKKKGNEKNIEKTVDN